MKRNKLIALLLACFLVLGLAACGGSETPADPPPAPADTPAVDTPVVEPVDDDIAPHTFTLANASPDDTVTGLFSHEFARLVSELSGGAMTVDVFPNSQLGGDAEIFTNVGVGEVDFIVGTTAPQVPTIPALAIFDLPVVFPSAQVARQVFEDPAFMDLVRAEYQAAGYRLLGFADQYYRVMSSNVRIDSMDDFSGVRIRTMENPFHMAFWSELGASPTPMAFAEVFIALQQGTIDAQENPHEVIVANAFYEVQDYIINTNHLLHIIALVANDANFEALSPAQQDVLLEAANIAIPWARAQADARVQQRIDVIEASGSTVLNISDELRAEIIATVQPVYEMIREAVGDNLYNALIEAVDRAS